MFFVLRAVTSLVIISSIKISLARDCQTSFRRAWRDLSCQEQDEFLEAIILIKESGVFNEFIEVHLQTAIFTHGPAEFLPWHRWFIWQFEKALQEATGRCIYIPYWDWERDAEWEVESDVMHPATFGTWGRTSSNGCTVDGITNYHRPFRNSPGVDNQPPGCVTRDFLEGFFFTGESQIVAMIMNYDQFADTTGNAATQTQDNPADQGTTNGFRTEFENGPHMLVHGIIAGHMGTNWSPSDPLFYLHHSNVDRIWAMWSDYWDHDECAVEDYSAPWHFDSIRTMDERLPFQSDRNGRISSWDFRMWYNDGRRPEFPTVRDVLYNDSPNMSVRYQNSYLNTLIPGYEPNPRLFQTANDFVPVKCDRDEWEWMRRNRNLQQEPSNNTASSSHTPASESLFHLLVSNTTVMKNIMSKKQGSGHYRTSLRGNDAQTIEDDAESMFSSGNKIKSKFEQTENNEQNNFNEPSLAVDFTLSVCAHPPVFTLKETRDEWSRLCRELPMSTPMEDRLAILAQHDCNRRGNQRSDAPELRERVNITMMKAFDAPSTAYECFHRPERPDRKSVV